MLRKLFRRPETLRPVVSFDAEKFTVRWPDGNNAVLRWSDIWRIAYQSSDQGPGLDDHFLVFQKKDSSCFRVSLEWTGAMALADHVDHLPGTRFGKLGVLADCTENKTHIVWPADEAGKTSLD